MGGAIMKLLILIGLVFPLLLAASGEPGWLTALRAKEAENDNKPHYTDVDVVPRPADSVAGYWKVTFESTPATTKEVRVASLNPDYDGPTTRTITVPEKVIRKWEWVEEPVKFQGNTDSMVVHKEGCRYWDCKSCTAYFVTFEAAVEQGYRACGICKPEETEE
jgi:hypothetical protein